MCIVSFFATVEACRRASVSWSRYISSSGRSSSLSPVTISLSSSVVEGMASAQVHGYWDVVHGWRCICGVVILRVAPLLVVALPVILKGRVVLVGC